MTVRCILSLASTLAVLVTPLVPAAQRTQTAAIGHRGSAFIAPRFHDEFQAGENGGARLAGDVDRDGDIDLLALAFPAPRQVFPAGVQTWKNDGRGNFTRAHELAFDVPMSSFLGFDLARHIYLEDFTGDGVLDVAYERKDVFQDVGPSGVFVHPGLGDGDFGPGLFRASNGAVLDLAAGDRDGDGVQDLLVHESNSGTDYRSTLAWWQLVGGSFVVGPALLTESEVPVLLTTLDLGSDGVTDAIAIDGVQHTNLLVYRSVGGALALETILPIPAGMPARPHFGTGDIDGDGDDDVLLTQNDPSAPEVLVVALLWSDTGFQASTVQSFANPFPGETLAPGGTLADWDADGDLDYVSPIFSWLENTGGASFRFAARQPWARNQPFRGMTQVVDLDGDGHLDVIDGDASVSGRGTWPLASSNPVWDSPQVPLGELIEDWDHDGDLDLVHPFGVAANNGDGTFTGHSGDAPDLGVSVRIEEVGWGDFDGDGYRDRLVALFQDRPPYAFLAMRLFAGTASGPYALSPVVPTLIEIPAGGNLAGDLDGDGDQDLLTRDGFWSNDGSGRFGLARVPAYVGRPLLAQDVDGDGDLDLLVQRAGRLELLTNLGALLFDAADFGSYVEALHPVFLDADEDGHLDLVVADPSSDEVTVRAGLDGGGFAAPVILVARGVIGPVGQLDVDGDGRLDLVAGRRIETAVFAYQVVSAWLRGSGLQFERRDWGARETPLAFADLDQDGDVDLIGRQSFENLRFDGPSAGRAVQYGFDAATSGAGGVYPVLGTGGPCRAGEPVVLSLGRGRGGVAGWLLLGQDRADVLEFGIRRLVANPRVLRTFVLEGTAGAYGQGTLEVRLPPSFAIPGRKATFQAVLIDHGADGLSATNGLEIHFGDVTLSNR